MLSREEVTKLRKAFHDAVDNDRAVLLRALSDPGRLRIVKLLCENDEICVSDIASVFEMSLPAISQQLKVLELSGIVYKERMGQMICYRLRKDNQIIRPLLKLIFN